jgi:DNA-binding response OmpR family regulator
MARDLLRLMLERAGFTIQEAVDGVDALEKIKQDPPDLVILDVMMPGIDGFEVCRELRSSQATAELPIIMLSARAHSRAVREGLDAGADKYLSKLTSRKELIQNIRELLEDSPGSEPT